MAQSEPPRPTPPTPITGIDGRRYSPTPSPAAVERAARKRQEAAELREGLAEQKEWADGLNASMTDDERAKARRRRPPLRRCT